jgi:aldehyde dehydrogenase (NAD+)
MTTATQSSPQSHKNYVSGAWVEGVKIAEDVNPSDTNDVVRLYTYGDANQVNAAVAAAKDAFLAWSRPSIQLRHDILKRVGDEILARKDELGRLLSREEGKTLAEGVGEVVRAGQIFLFFSGECLRLVGDKSRRCGSVSTWR